jgi:hypothetical protein
MAAALLVAWIYIVARAKNVSFVCDEALSFGILHGEQTFVDTPNNQWLNTLLMRVSQFIFDESEFALRSPNVASFGIYGAALLAVLSRLRHPTAKVAGFVLLAINPFLLEFFGLARGYGLSLAFSMAAIACTFWRKRSASARRELARMALTGAFGALAFYANFSALNLVLALLGVEMIDLGVLFYHQHTHKLPRPARRAAIGIVCASGASLLPGILYLRHLQHIGQLYYGGHSGLVTDVVGSLLRSSSCGLKCQPSWLAPAEVTVVVVAALGIAWTTYRLVGGNRWQNITRATVIFAIAVLATVLESSLLGTLYPIDRTALVYVVVFAVFVAFVIDDVMTTISRARVVLGVAVACFAVLTTVNLVRDANLTRTTIWAYDASSHEVIDALIRYEQRHGRPPSPWKLISGFPRDEALNYYRRRFQIRWLQPVGREPAATPDGNFYYVSAQELPELPSGTQLLARFSSTGTELRVAHVRPVAPHRPTQFSAARGVTISATPNPVPTGPNAGTTTVTWSATRFPRAEVRLSIARGPAELFARGPRGSSTAAFIATGAEYIFRVYPDDRSQRVLALVTVVRG